MMERDEATQRQINAADPNRSTWLSANAGSGKTRVLTDRVARLLFQGVDPQNILCLTYTKAAASEMQNRLFERLGEWSMFDDEALANDLTKLGVESRLTPEDLARARTLFASAVETPGGLKIQTIHSFCSSLLRRFPLEAGLSPDFKEMEERASELLHEQVLDEMATGNDVGLIDGIAKHYTSDTITDFTSEIARNKERFLAKGAMDRLANSLGLPDEPLFQHALDMAFRGDEMDVVDAVSEVAPALSATIQKLAAALCSLNLKKPAETDLEILFDKFLYADDTSKSRNYPQSNWKKAVEAFSPFINDLHEWMDRVTAAKDYLKAINALERSRALHLFAASFLTRYAEHKQRAGMLDFDDLISLARDLLTDRNVAEWVLFKLDGGIDHMLVDEAQDTSPTQWQVVQMLAREFSTGEGARPDRHRTIFVVGDKKQSIYSFQGADPKGFDRMRDHFETELDGIGETLQITSLDHSFRSSPAILRAVDQTFFGERAKGVDTEVFHKAFHDEMPGRVDLWPVVEPVEKGDQEGNWYDPVDVVGPRHNDLILAHEVAENIKQMIATETLTYRDGNVSRRRPVRAGDIIILVQRRSDLFRHIIAACKAAKLEVAGADRLKIGTELAVKDITALLRFLALPEDDLSLASVLKSPLFGWSEQDLYSLAQPRPKNQYLWRALRDTPETHPKTLAILTDLSNNTDFLRPYDLIERMLTRHGGRKNLLARLGPEAEDGIDALLGQALAYERAEIPSLTGFLVWLEGGDLTVKRQLDNAGDQIRVMTVHGAKGLEAPIVILPDTAKRKPEQRAQIYAADETALWKSPSKQMPSAMTALKDARQEAEEEERMRLLYVAMTRAESWLIICASGEVGDVGESWYRIVEEGFTRLSAVTHEHATGTGQRFSEFDWNAAPLSATQTTPVTPQIDAPQYPPIIAPSGGYKSSKTLAPSDLGGDKSLRGEVENQNPDAPLIRGRQIHLLLEHLPDCPPNERLEMGRVLLASGEDVVEGEAADQMISEVNAIVNAPALQFLFAPDALAEVDITGTLPNGARIHGAIDRLLVTPERILAVDFKSNQIVPKRPEDTPEGVLRQMGAYLSALRQIFPNRPIEMAILWTNSTNLMPIPIPLVEAALIRVSPP